MILWLCVRIRCVPGKLDVDIYWDIDLLSMSTGPSIQGPKRSNMCVQNVAEHTNRTGEALVEDMVTEQSITTSITRPSSTSSETLVDHEDTSAEGASSPDLASDDYADIATESLSSTSGSLQPVLVGVVEKSVAGDFA